MKSIHKMETVRVIPVVLTWDGIVTNYYKNYFKKLKVPENIQAYIQFRVLKKTSEIIISTTTRERMDETTFRIAVEEAKVEDNVVTVEAST